MLCQITEGKPGACDRYANQGGVLVRVDPVLLLARAQAGEALATGELVPFVDAAVDDPIHRSQPDRSTTPGLQNHQLPD